MLTGLGHWVTLYYLRTHSTGRRHNQVEAPEFQKLDAGKGFTYLCQGGLAYKATAYILFGVLSLLDGHFPQLREMAGVSGQRLLRFLQGSLCLGPKFTR